MIIRPFVALGKVARNWTTNIDPWTNVYGLARTILALATAATLSATHISALFANATSPKIRPYCVGPANIGIFCLFASHLELARWVAVVILALVATGWRPRITGLLHWWVSFSLQSSAILIDGGDQVTAILTLLLIPVTMTDQRRWHWQTPTPIIHNSRHEEWKRLIALFALTAIRVQVAGIYFHSAIEKLHVQEWVDGTAVYYWFTNPTFGAPSWRLRILTPLVTHGITVALMSWGAILIEIILFMALVMPKKAWGYVLVIGIMFHIMIALIHGLISFSLAMVAALILYLRPIENSFKPISLQRPLFRRPLREWFIPL